MSADRHTDVASKRAELRARVAARRQAVQARRARPEGRPPGKKRRPTVFLVLLLLALLALCCGLVPCDPEHAATGVPHPVEPPPSAEPSAPAKPGASAPRLGTTRRPGFDQGTPESVAWVAEFRLQVAARGDRLSQCFDGADAPGALRWSALVEPLSGRVSEAEVSPILQTAELTRAQRTCVLQTLSQPSYRLRTEGERSTPLRVGVVLEF